MNLKLTEEYTITTNEYNVILNGTKKADSRGSTLKPIGYYSSFTKAIAGCLFHGLKTSEVAGLKAIIRKQEELEEQIQDNLLKAVSAQEEV